MKYFVIRKGKKTWIVTSRPECQSYVSGYPWAKYKSFPTETMAQKAYEMWYDAVVGKDTRVLFQDSSMIDRYGQPVQESIAVDAACAWNPWLLEFRWVSVATGEELFRQWPYEWGTVNIGEFLALVEALQLPFWWIIYSDSRIAMSRVAKKKSNTQLPHMPHTEHLHNKLAAAEQWLNDGYMSWKNDIRKWHTKVWWEIPADFGRK